MPKEVSDKLEFDPQTMLNEFEAAWDDELSINNYKAKIKYHQDCIKERMNDFSAGYSIDKKILSKAYGRFKELKLEKFDPNDETYYSAIAAVDEFFAEEEDQD